MRIKYKFFLIFLLFFSFFLFNFLFKKYLFLYKINFFSRKILYNLNKHVVVIKYDLSRNNNYILWWHLSKLYEIQKREKESYESLKIAFFLHSVNLKLIMDYILIKFKNNKYKLNKYDIFLINKILIIYPSKLELYNILSINSYNNNNFYLAIQYWGIILNNLNNIKYNKLIKLIQQRINNISFI